MKDFDNPKYYFNRELSWLKFNQRVLQESIDRSNPLMEKLRFLTIGSSNLDEFFMIRVSGLRHQEQSDIIKYDAAHMDAKAQLKAISEATKKLVSLQYMYFHDILKRLQKEGLHFVKVKDLKEVQDGAQVAIPSDATNGGRALLLLSKAGLITLNDPNSISATVQDIKDNPKNLKFVELEAAQLPRTLDDSTISVINTNFALGANLNPTKDALFLESKDSPYVNIVSVREGDEKREDIQKLIKALQSPEIKKFIEDKYKGAILPAF